MTLWIAIILAGLLIVPSASLSREYYRWVDENGVIQFSDRPPDGEGTTEVLQHREIQTIKTVSVGELSSHGGQVQRRYGGPFITMYGAQWCGYCAKARDYFARNRIRYREYDIETSARGRREYEALNGTGVPLLVIGDQVMRGFREESFERIYQAMMR